MKVVILGAGQVGQSIAKYLASDENSVTIIDKDHDLIDSLGKSVDVQAICGFVSHPHTLKSANIEEAEVLLCVTNHDEVNIVACEVAKGLNPNITTVCRLRHQQYFENGHHITDAIDVTISPELEVALAISRNAAVPGSFDVVSLGGHSLKVVGVRCKAKSQILNTPIKLIPTLLSQVSFSLFCITRQDVTFFPSPNEQLFENDEVYFIAKEEDVPKIMPLFSQEHVHAHYTLIIGAGRIGRHLAARLSSVEDMTVQMIEKDPAISEIATLSLPGVEVLCGDALDYDVLKEINLERFKTVISVTNDDKVNILSGLITKKTSDARTLILLNNMAYANLVHSLGIDSVIVPKALTISTILSHLQKAHIQTIYSLTNDYLVIAATVFESSFILGLMAEDVEIPQKIQILCVRRNQNTFFSFENIVFSHKDYIVLNLHRDSLTKVEKLFSQRPDYL